MPQLRRLTSAVVLASTLGLLPAPHADAAPRVTQSQASEHQVAVQGALAELNDQRAAQGLRPLQLDTSMAAGAQAWAEHMASTTVFEHDLTNLPTTQSEVIAGTFWGEQDGAPPLDGATPIHMWQGSYGHNRIIMDAEARVIGFGVAQGCYADAAVGMRFCGWYWVGRSSRTQTHVAPPVVTPTSPAPHVNRRSRIWRTAERRKGALAPTP